MNLHRAVLEAASGTLGFAVTNLTAGQTAAFDVSGARPGGVVWLAFSLTGTALTPVPQLSATLSLAAPAPLASLLADPAGAASLARTVPPAVQGAAVWFQAVESGNASPFLATTVQ